MNQEIKFNNATIRIHGAANQDNLKKAATDYLKKVEFQRRRVVVNDKKAV